ncbi:MAG: threonine/serine dehydratase [Acidimicrobiia bacterium]
MLTLQAIEATVPRIEQYVHRTPMVRSATLSSEFDRNIYLKLELFQKTGSFKPRGAFNQILGLDGLADAKGVVGFSGGNFAQGVSYAGGLLGLEVRIFMPEFTPGNYVDGTRSYGADVRLLPNMHECMAQAEASLAEGFLKVHPYDSQDMMIGNGTLGLEIMADVADASDVFVSIGGGGLLGGVATAIKALSPRTRLWGVETEGAGTMTAALAAGHVVDVQTTSLARTLAPPNVSADALEIAQQTLEEVVLVSDGDAFESLEFLLERAKILTELAASCTLSAARARRDQLGDDVVLILCGGNVSVADVCDMRLKFS